jgi:hypothetical protein
MTMSWVTISWREYAYTDETGRILGRVHGLSRTYTAMADGPLGEYIDKQSAKQAVEQAVGARAPGGQLGGKS